MLDIETCADSAGQHFGYPTAVALAPGAEVSFRATTPCCTGDFIRHQNGQGESLSWNATPADYLRHYDGELYVASDGGPDAWDDSTSWTDDVSWIPVPAWAP